MSEKAACPRCDSYASEVFYDRRHSWCGWNCHVEYVLRAHGSQGNVKLVTPERPTAEIKRDLASVVGADSVVVTVLVDGYAPESNRPLSVWLDPNAEPPKPISDRKRKANLKELRDKIARDATEGL